jgi:ABC-type nickel/cobalt efflux system permease component RcnA
MDYLNAAVLVTPAWIVLGALGVLFTRKLLWVYVFVCVLLAVVSWVSGVSEVRDQRSFYDRQKAVELSQQALNDEFEKLAISLRMAPDSPHQMILDRMHAMDCKALSSAATSPKQNKSN